MDVVVLGSLNMDLVAQVPHLPQPGETLLGKSFATIPGGKGGNQAVAAARLGARTAMVGRVGNDEMGKALRSRLADENINTQGVNISPRASSGTALISVSPSNNQIVVVPGANAEVDDTELDALMYYFEQARVLLLQFEIPLDMVEKAAALGHTAGLTVIVDPAPAQGPLPVDAEPDGGSDSDGAASGGRERCDRGCRNLTARRHRNRHRKNGRHGLRVCHRCW